LDAAGFSLRPHRLESLCHPLTANLYKVSAMGTLYIVATPIGNLEDITLRALRVLKEADLIAAEDTRHTKKLLNHFGIGTPLISYHAHNQASRGPELIQRLEQGENVALVSDAGTPGFSDPGADLVARAWDAGVKVTAVPGPAAGVAALSLSGFKGDILFVGFLPRGEGRRLKMFQALASEPRVIILYESPRRLARTLGEIAGTMPGRQVLVVRELTKKFEETWRGPVAEIAARLQEADIRGECALVLSCPATGVAAPPADLEGLLLAAARESGLQGRRLADRVAQDHKLPRRLVYQACLALKEQGRLE
jgi:16S rRNA (cytidine1402-2'-O)-methyltransferase